MRARRSAIGLAAVLGLVAAGACAPARAPAPAPASLAYPDFVFPSTPAPLARTGQAQRMQRGWQRLQAGDIGGARQEFTSALEARPAFYPAHAGLGYASLAEKNYADAADRFSRALDRDARYVPALVGRGDARVGLGRFDDATRDLRAAVEANPSLTDVRRRLDVLTFRSEQEALRAARSAAVAGRLDEAAAAYQRAIARSPDSALLYRELAEVERGQGRLDLSAGHLRTASSLEPSDARTLVQLGEVLEAQKDFAAAADAYSRAAALDPDEQVASRAAAARARGSVAPLPAPFQAIPASPHITRGELAALVGVRLGSVIESAPRREGVVVTDVRGHWAAAWIVAVARAGVMAPYPNHAFAPEALVTRIDLAQTVGRVLGLMAAGDEKAAAAWQAARPTMTDLPPDHLGYPAAAAAVAAGVMPLLDGATFRPSRTVSGVEAIDTVARLARWKR